MNKKDSKRKLNKSNQKNVAGGYDFRIRHEGNQEIMVHIDLNPEERAWLNNNGYIVGNEGAIDNEGNTYNPAELVEILENDYYGNQA